VLSINCR